MAGAAQLAAYFRGRILPPLKEIPMGNGQKVVIVTSASQSIGTGLVSACRSRGWNVVAVRGMR